MAKQPGKQIAEATAEPRTKGAEPAEKIVRGRAEALTVRANASRAAVQELTRAYQELATKNAKNLTAAMQALAAVKSPAEFIELQQRLTKEGVEAAVSDGRHIAQLTTAVFTAAFEPVKKQLREDRPDLGQSGTLCFEGLQARPPIPLVSIGDIQSLATHVRMRKLRSFLEKKTLWSVVREQPER